MNPADDRYSLRAAKRADFDDIPRVQRAAIGRYRDFGMPEVAEGPVIDADLLATFTSEGALFVATHDERIVAFVGCAPLDGAAHVAEVHVVPAHARRGLGACLIDRLDEWAAVRDMMRLTLATYRDVPFNAPYYARLGFREIRAEALGPEHVAVWEAQGDLGLDLSKRLLMERPSGRREVAHGSRSVGGKARVERFEGK